MANEGVDVRQQPQEGMELEFDQQSDLHSQLGYIEARLKVVKNVFPNIGPNEQGHITIDRLMEWIAGRKQMAAAEMIRMRTPDA
jgi:hypothetical protein